MRFRKTPNLYLSAVVFALASCQMALYFTRPVSAHENATYRSVAPVAAIDKSPKEVPRGRDRSRSAKPNNRAASVRAVVAHLGLGRGSVVADIGAGKGRDTWVFAEIVGETGTVFAEEIADGMVESLKTEAEKKGLSQVCPVLGRTNDPCLSPDSIDLVYLNHVYHHFAKPREMLQGIWRTLRSNGYLVVVDRQRGTLRNWVPRQLREKKHYWIAETTVVREAREEGFAFVEYAEQYWHTNNDFVLIFQRPKELQKPGRDPDPFLHIPTEECSHLFLPVVHQYRKPVFIALGQARELISPILKNSSGEGLDIVLEEWATQKQERPPLPPNVCLSSVLTEKGDPNLGDELVDVVFFLDSYHLLFHGQTLLARLHAKLSPTGCVYILDRRAKEPLSRREASHRRKIEPKTVRHEMAEAGFFLWFRGPRSARDRFLFVFGKTRAKKVPSKDDPFVGGPEIPRSPGQWLTKNSWRLRGLRTVDGRIISLRPTGQRRLMERVPGGSPGKETWKIPREKLVLYFEIKDEEYLLTDYRSLDQQ